MATSARPTRSATVSARTGAPGGGTSAAARARLAEAQRARLVGGVVAAAGLVLLAMRIDLPAGLTVGYLLSAVLAPLWLPVLRLYRGARLLLVVGLAAIGSGLWLTQSFAATHDTSISLSVTVAVGLAGILLAIGFLLWCRTVLTDAQVALFFGIGLLLGVTPTSELYLSNPWRFGYSVALTIIVLALARLTGRRGLELIAVAGFTVIAAFTDARSAFAILMLTALLVLWQMRPGRRRRTTSAARVIVAIVALAAVVFALGQALILDGALGQETQLRSDAQLQTSGSLILGGRPELAATAALMLHQPLGFGTGTVPSGADVLAAKAGLNKIGYDPDNDYVDVYMFGGHIELHSVAGDLWAGFGIPGLLLAAVIVGLILRGLGLGVAGGTASAVAIYLAVKLLWAMLFGPLFSSATLIVLAVGLLLVRRPEAEPDVLPGPARAALS